MSSKFGGSTSVQNLLEGWSSDSKFSLQVICMTIMQDCSDFVCVQNLYDIFVTSGQLILFDVWKWLAYLPYFSL